MDFNQFVDDVNVEAILTEEQGRQAYIVPHGTMCPQLVTNLRWFKEGVSLVNPKAKLEVTLSKSEYVLVNVDTLTPEWKEKLGLPVNATADMEQVATAIRKISAELEVILSEEMDKTKTYRKGMTIFAYPELGILIRHRKSNQPVKLVGYEFLSDEFNPRALKVRLKLAVQSNNNWKKIRGYGRKATLATYPVEMWDKETGTTLDNWVVAHSMSGLKGRPMDLEAFSSAVGGAILDMENGAIKVGEKWFDLTKHESVVDRWRNAVARVGIIKLPIARAEYEFILAVDEYEGFAGGAPDILDVKLVDDDTVEITAEFEYYEAVLPLNVEISLPEEKSTPAGMTPEMVSVLSVLDRQVGEMVVAEGQSTRDSIKQLVGMMTFKPVEGTPELEISSTEGINQIKQLVGDSLSAKVSAAEVLRAYQKAFPVGVVFVTHSAYGVAQKGFLSFSTIGRIATFIGGSADGVADQVCQFLRELTYEVCDKGYETRLHAKWSLVRKSMKGWLRSQLISRSLRKKLAASPKGIAVGAVVRTIDLPELNHQGTAPNCIPKVGLNPRDENLRELAKGIDGKIRPEFLEQQGDCDGDLSGGDNLPKVRFNPYLMNGQYITVYRTPMVMQTVCQIVVTKNVAVGQFAILTHIWSMMHEGDSDGDTGNMFSIEKYWAALGLSAGEMKARALYINNHAMGMGGYSLVYGVERGAWPCAEFSSYKDSQLKKKLILTLEQAKMLEKKGILPYVRKVALKDWVSVPEQVSQHYKVVVGGTYNMCVMATNHLLQLSYAGVTGTELTVAEETAAVCWRLLYEGIGLAGYKPEAAYWSKLLNMSPFMRGQFTLDKEGMPTFASKSTPKHLIKDVSKEFKYLGDGEGYAHMKNADKISDLILTFAGFKADWGTLENPNKTEGKQKRYANIVKDEKRFNAATLNRALRLISQGLDGGLADLMDIEAIEEEEDGGGQESEIPAVNSLRKIAYNPSLVASLACPWQQEILYTAASFTVVTTKWLHDEERAELEQF